MLPLVTVVIPFYNCPYIPQAIQSVLDQSYPSIEIIVVDDGSTSNQHLLDPYRHRIVYLSKANGGTATALNYGMQCATGQYVAWLSSDDLFTRDKVLNQVSYMLEKRAQFCFTDFNTINETGQITQLCSMVKFPTEKAFIASMLDFCPVNGCTVMMLRSLIQNVGWFNPGLPYAHDYDLWARIALHDVGMHYLNEPLTLYRRHAGMGTVQHLARIMPEFESLKAYYAPMLRTKLARMPG
ncbi:glycosyltransferase [Paenibacillus albicereus]|uniref:Glycosyltransferase n=1 Tax=Paenibacillus albicereus TaxID=2726185 RepID=A0A6H2GVH0_9BACL|nr:glycosyltransferase [Paenibacillus albicereus]QJC51424.1 glycosyltransferase [Paenibacillus albicereus]